MPELAAAVASAEVLVGGGPADPALLRRAIDAGIPALQTYGMTETCSQVCTVAPEDAERDLGTAGRPLTGAAVAVDDDGRVRVRGPMVSAGYLGEEPRSDEWFVTGDLGSIDPEGRLTGRADAVIVTGGENVHPALVERALRTVAGVVDARVSGEPDAEWGSGGSGVGARRHDRRCGCGGGRGLLRRFRGAPDDGSWSTPCRSSCRERPTPGRDRPPGRASPHWNGRLVRATESVVMSTTESARTTAAGGDEPR